MSVDTFRILADRKFKQPETALITVTPEIAAFCLSRNKSNRAVNSSRVQTYSNEMAGGRWLLNHQGIAFNNFGNMFDGQHRCLAVIRSGVSVQMFVTFGVFTGDSVENRNVFMTVDIGSPKRASSMLSALGVSKAGQLASAAKAALLAASNQKACIGATPTQVSRCIDVIGEDLRAIVSNNNGKNIKKAQAWLVGTCALYRTVDQEKADRFFSEVINMPSGRADASAAMNYYIARNGKLYGGSFTIDHINVAKTAIHKFHTGASVDVIRIKRPSSDSLRWFDSEIKHRDELLEIMPS